MRDLRDDEASLRRIVRHHGLPENRLKQAAARIGELVGRLKANGELRRYSPLSRLLELELLLSGIDENARSGVRWTRPGSTSPPRSTSSCSRTAASHQRARLRPHHLDAARDAFASQDAHAT